MNLLDIQIAVEDCYIPEQATLQQWIDAALQQHAGPTELVVRIVDEAESAQLNERYRHKKGPTNILSFPFEAPAGVDINLLGDLVVCAPVVAREAEMQQKALQHHWAHIIIHGALHLLGYDHIEASDAERMEWKEISILQQFNIPDPYLEDS